MHRATINEYLADQGHQRRNGPRVPATDLLADNADALSNSYVAVPPDATIEEAMAG